MKFSQRGAFALIVSLAFIFVFYNLQLAWPSQDLSNSQTKLMDQLKQMEKNMVNDEIIIREMRENINQFARHKFDRDLVVNRRWNQPIPVLIFVCNRADAAKYHIQRLLSIRKSVELFPIIISQDCDNKQVADVVRQFGDQITYVKHPNTKVVVPKSQRRYAIYYKIAAHYKLGLQYVFNQLNHTSVIITEDDLDISEDFFEYFAATRPLLAADPTLYCVSAWNDNGKAENIDETANELLYRSDFFPGLGWMMSLDLWMEIGSRWPAGFWDDWIREPEQRRNRSCIRPEISRTAMTLQGQRGASKGLFFNRHLKKINLNKQPVSFTTKRLDYLLKVNYDSDFLHTVYSLPSITVDDFLRLAIVGKIDSKTHLAYRIEYATMIEYTMIVKALHIMADTKAGVGRTAYLGVVTCFIGGLRAYVAPPQYPAWLGYQPKWEAPSNLLKDTI